MRICRRSEKSDLLRVAPGIPRSSGLVEAFFPVIYCLRRKAPAFIGIGLIRLVSGWLDPGFEILLYPRSDPVWIAVDQFEGSNELFWLGRVRSRVRIERHHEEAGEVRNLFRSDSALAICLLEQINGFLDGKKFFRVDIQFDLFLSLPVNVRRKFCEE